MLAGHNKDFESKRPVSAVRNQNDGFIYLIYSSNFHSTTAKLDKEFKDRCVLSLKWNNQGAIRKHNRNILLHIEVKSYTTRGRLLRSKTRQTRLQPYGASYVARETGV